MASRGGSVHLTIVSITNLPILQCIQFKRTTSTWATQHFTVATPKDHLLRPILTGPCGLRPFPAQAIYLAQETPKKSPKALPQGQKMKNTPKSEVNLRKAERPYKRHQKKTLKASWNYQKITQSSQNPRHRLQHRIHRLQHILHQHGMSRFDGGFKDLRKLRRLTRKLGWRWHGEREETKRFLWVFLGFSYGFRT